MFSISSWQAVLFLAPTLARCQYQLQDDYFQSGFFDNFDFFNGPDPTNGFVQYAGQIDSLISSSSSQAQMHVSSDQVTPNGRPSIRITSKESYQTGLIVLDVEHMPGGICGTWPAFWTVGPNWPAGGEIDIIEGVNDVQSNQMTLHTGSTCSISASSMTGSLSTDNCEVSNGDNTGCGITTADGSTYGSAFNANGGGTYATLLSSTGVIVWFWPRGSEPGDVLGSQPDPASWSTPLANFTGGCDFSSSFTAQQIVFDTTFCGDWAGQVWSQGGCAAKAATCEDYVANNGADFAEAYWSINALKVYQEVAGAPAPTASVPAPPPTSVVAPSSAPSSAAAPSSTPVPSANLAATPSTVAPSAIPSTTSVVPNATPLPSLTTLLTSVRAQSQRPPGPPQGTFLDTTAINENTG